MKRILVGVARLCAWLIYVIVRPRPAWGCIHCAQITKGLRRHLADHAT